MFFIVQAWLALFLTGGEGELGGIEDVLPDDVGCGAKRRKRIEIGLCHPDAEGGVFLSESLSGGDRRDASHSFGCSGRVDEHVLVVAAFARSRQAVADEFANAKLEKACKETADEEPKNSGELRVES